MRKLVATALAVATLDAALATAQTRSFGWKVTAAQGAIYLIGSVHLLPKDAYPLNASIESAYKDSDLLVEEVDLAEMNPTAQMNMLSRGMQPSSQPLDKVLSPSTMALLTRKAADLGLPVDVVKQFKPWMIAITVESMQWQKAGFDPELGLDKHFYNQAQSDNKPVQGLETVDYQISRFDEMPIDLQDHLLAETLKSIDTEQASMAKLIAAWRSGDVKTVEGIVLKDLQQEPVLYQRLLVERNRNWLPKLDALLARRGRALVVVGAAHLVGPDGLLALLRAKGYRVDQL